MQNSIVMLTFSVFNRKYPFWINLVQNIKIGSLSWNLVTRLIRFQYAEFSCGVHFFQFRLVAKVGPKHRNFQFKLKFGTKTNSHMQNSVVTCTFLFLTKDAVFGQIWSKNETCSIVVFTVFVLELKFLCFTNSVQEIKIVSLRIFKGKKHHQTYAVK